MKTVNGGGLNPGCGLLSFLPHLKRWGLPERDDCETTDLMRLLQQDCAILIRKEVARISKPA
jgi:hypothetical protein